MTQHLPFYDSPKDAAASAAKELAALAGMLGILAESMPTYFDRHALVFLIESLEDCMVALREAAERCP